MISKDATEEQFARRIEELAKVNEFLIAEDDNGALSKRGPVAVVGISSDGWKLEPHVEFMAWATPKNKLRCTVAFFQMMVHRNIGVCFVKSLVSSKNLFDACMKYFSQYSFNYIGKIPAGDERGDEYLYSARGKKHVKTDE